MEKQTIVIRADSKEMAEKLHRGVWAVCPDTDIQLYWPGMNVAYGRETSSLGFMQANAMMGSPCPLPS